MLMSAYIILIILLCLSSDIFIMGDSVAKAYKQHVVIERMPPYEWSSFVVEEDPAHSSSSCVSGPDGTGRFCDYLGEVSWSGAEICCELCEVVYVAS